MSASGGNSGRSHMFNVTNYFGPLTHDADGAALEQNRTERIDQLDRKY